MKEAESLYREAIESGEEVLGPEHPHLAVYLANFANLLRDAGRTSEAEPLYERSLKILEQNMGNIT